MLGARRKRGHPLKQKLAVILSPAKGGGSLPAAGRDPVVLRRLLYRWDPSVAMLPQDDKIKLCRNLIMKS